MLGKYSTLVAYMPILTCHLFILKQYDYLYGDGVENQTEVYMILKRFHHFYFTGWNFGAQVIFLVLAIIDELVKLGRAGVGVGRFVNGLRSYLFQTIVFPCSFLVSATFWTLFIYDRELVFPASVDQFYPLWMNHAVHSYILLPVIIESCLSKTGNFIRFNQAFKGLTLYLFVYQILYLGIYFLHNVWLYPIFKQLTWTQRILLLTLEYFGCVLFMFIGIFLQNLKKITRKHNNLKNR